VVRRGVVHGRVELAAVLARPDAGRGRSRENPGMPTEVLRYAAFTTTPDGGNPAGVVLDAAGLDEAAMQAIAADVGYSETAFVTGVGDDADGGEGRRHVAVRYFSPLAEVPFCGHATIATGVAMGDRGERSDLVFHTVAGPVLVRVATVDGRPAATLTSVPPHTDPVADADLAEALAALGWREADLDPALPPRVAYAGARHLVLAAATRERLAALDYDMPRLGALMAARDWTTLQLVFRRSETTFVARDPFPPGGVVEDPATGAAAAALGGYLRELGLVMVPADLVVHQGDDLGRPSVLRVHVPAGHGTGIEVTGHAVPLG
jgi:PhzF family phenazine biosynthesis protein